MNNSYETALAALKVLNARVLAVNERAARAVFGDVAEWDAIIAERFAIRDEGKAAGFIRIFNGSFKLDLTKFNG